MEGKKRRKEENVLFDDALNTFYFELFGIEGEKDDGGEREREMWMKREK